MGTSKSAAELAQKMNKVGTAVPRAARTGVADAAAKGKTTILAVAASRGVSPSSRIAGGRWSVRYDLRGTTNPTALLRIRGAFHLVESPTRAHAILPRQAKTQAGRRRRRAGKKALVINGNLRASAQHRGTRGKHIFRDAKKRIVDDSPPTVMRHLVTDMSKVLG